MANRTRSGKAAYGMGSGPQGNRRYLVAVREVLRGGIANYRGPSLAPQRIFIGR